MYSDILCLGQRRLDFQTAYLSRLAVLIWCADKILQFKLGDFKGRNWLFKQIRAKVIEDVPLHEVRPILLLGDPGTGKSAVLARLVLEAFPSGPLSFPTDGKQFDKLAPDETLSIIAYHICSMTHKPSLSSKQFVLNVASQLSITVSDFKAPFASDFKKSPVDALIAVFDTLKATKVLARDKRHCILIDSFDESLLGEEVTVLVHTALLVSANYSGDFRESSKAVFNVGACLAAVCVHLPAEPRCVAHSGWAAFNATIEH